MSFCLSLFLFLCVIFASRVSAALFFWVCTIRFRASIYWLAFDVRAKRPIPRPKKNNGITLNSLDLSHNSLTKIPVMSLTNMAALTLCNLDLSHNDIVAIHTMDLSNKFRVRNFRPCSMLLEMDRCILSPKQRKQFSLYPCPVAFRYVPSATIPSALYQRFPYSSHHLINPSKPLNFLAICIRYIICLLSNPVRLPLSRGCVSIKIQSKYLFYLSLFLSLRMLCVCARINRYGYRSIGSIVAGHLRPIK